MGLYIFVAIAAIAYGFFAVYAVKQGGKYSVERGSSFKKGMIFPALIMAIPPIAIIAAQFL